MKIKAKDRRKLERALCVLVDYESAITAAMRRQSGSDSIGPVCDALRALVDDGFQPEGT